MAIREVDSKLYQQEIKISENALKLQSNFKLLLVGASGQGKTEWIISLVKSKTKHMVDEFEEIIYCIPHNSGHLTSVKNAIEKMKAAYPNIVVYEGLLLDISSVFNPTNDSAHCLIIYDDQYTDIINSRLFCHLATFGSRHHNCSIIVSSQNVFESSKYALSIRRQFNYYLLFNPPSEKQMLVSLGKNLFPTNPHCLINCFKKLAHYTSSPFEQYLLIDVNPRSPLPSSMKLRSAFFSDEPYFFLTED